MMEPIHHAYRLASGRCYGRKKLLCLHKMLTLTPFQDTDGPVGTTEAAAELRATFP